MKGLTSLLSFILAVAMLFCVCQGDVEAGRRANRLNRKANVAAAKAKANRQVRQVRSLAFIDAFGRVRRLDRRGNPQVFRPKVFILR